MNLYSSREILQILLKDGWTIKKQKGSHIQLVHATKAGKVTVPHPKKELDPKTARSIFKQAQLEI